jgi:hypothetical protein
MITVSYRKLKTACFSAFEIWALELANTLNLCQLNELQSQVKIINYFV